MILHGYFGMSDNWKSMGLKFAEDFEVHLIDQRNHGRSFHAYEFKDGVWNFVDKVFNESVDTPPGEGLKQDVPRDILGRKKN